MNAAQPNAIENLLNTRYNAGDEDLNVEYLECLEEGIHEQLDSMGLKWLELKGLLKVTYVGRIHRQRYVNVTPLGQSYLMAQASVGSRFKRILAGL